MQTTPLKIGISACLLGAKVRFDGGHKISHFVTDELARYVEFVSVCPEIGMGLPVPRATLRLISEGVRIALVETKDGTRDHTEGLERYSQQKVAELQTSDLCGYIVCAKSPSCGMERVKVYKQHGTEKEGVGIYTRILMEKMPWLPVEEDGRLNDPVLRENFITRLYCLHDFYTSMGEAPSAKKVVDFHSRYKLSLMAHHPESYRVLGKWVANVKQYPLDTFIQEYRLGLMQALAHRASRKNNTNVLMHLQGYFKRSLNKLQKAELSHVIESYRLGELPLLAPLTLLKHYLALYPDGYLDQQRYL
ncbi:MAG: YbgA family protein, partial [Vibrio sp.]